MLASCSLGRREEWRREKGKENLNGGFCVWQKANDAETKYLNPGCLNKSFSAHKPDSYRFPLIFNLLKSFLPICFLSHNCRGCIVDTPVGLGTPWSLILHVLTTCVSQHLLEKELLWWRGKAALICVYKDKSTQGNARSGTLELKKRKWRSWTLPQMPLNQYVFS